MRYFYLLFFAATVSLSAVSCEEDPTSLEVDNRYSSQSSDDDDTTIDIDETSLAEIIELADDYLEEELYTITTKDDSSIAPMGLSEDGVTLGEDKRYYTSIGSYYWPTYDAVTGEIIAYYYDDGVYNSNSTVLFPDVTTFSDMRAAVVALGEAYYYTKDSAYASKIQDIIRTFFIATDTKMLPNLDFGKMSFDTTTQMFLYGECFGIIETLSIQDMLIGVRQAQEWSGWSSAVSEGLNDWVEAYADWLITDELGEEEGAIYTASNGIKNNHGTHFDSQYLALLWHLGRTAEIKEYVESVCSKRLYLHVVESTSSSVDNDTTKAAGNSKEESSYCSAGVGAQQTELSRTKSWNYTIMNLRGWLRIAEYAEWAGVDLWHQTSTKTGCTDVILIKSMCDWFIPFITGEKDWTWEQITTGALEDVIPHLEKAAEIYTEDAAIYEDAIANIQPFTPTVSGSKSVE